jgi:ATP-dependent helicase/nuclease subunit B
VRELSRSDFEPAEFEKKISVAVPDAGILLEGTIDRVDRFSLDGRDFVRVSDYKTGSTEFSLSDVMNGFKLQMLLYLYALGDSPAAALYTPSRDALITEKSSITFTDDDIETRLADKLRRKGLVLADARVIDALETGEDKRFIPVSLGKSGGYEGKALITDEQFGLLTRHTDGYLRSVADALRGGDISVNPFESGDRNACIYCDFRAACALGSEKGDAYRRLPFYELQEVWQKLGGDAQ